MGRTVLAMSRRTNAVGNGFMATRGFTTPATTGHRLRTSLIISLAADSKKVHITVTIAMTKAVGIPTDHLLLWGANKVLGALMMTSHASKVAKRRSKMATTQGVKLIGIRIASTPKSLHSKPLSRLTKVCRVF